jgi:hypothetical protein
MALAVACPECGQKYQVRAELAGKRFRCKKCEARVAIPETAETDGGYRLRDAPARPASVAAVASPVFEPAEPEDEVWDADAGQADALLSHPADEGDKPERHRPKARPQELTANFRKYEILSLGERKILHVRPCVFNLPLGPATKIPLDEYRSIEAREGDSLGTAIGNFMLYLLAVVFTGGFALIVILLFGLRYRRIPFTITFSADRSPDVALEFPNGRAMQQFTVFLKKAAGIKVSR